MNHVCVNVDDVLITGRTNAEHLNNLSEVPRRMQEAGMRLKRDKGCFMLLQVQYLGQGISPHGIQPKEDKIQVIQEAAAPANVHQLK